MPTRPPRTCPTPGCSGLWDGSRCTKCNRKPSTGRGDDKRRGAHRTRQKRWYDSKRWKRASRAYLAENPLCVACEAEGRDVPAEVVDHIEPAKGDAGRFWDQTNWAALCRQHHDAKSGRE